MDALSPMKGCDFETEKEANEAKDKTFFAQRWGLLACEIDGVASCLLCYVKKPTVPSTEPLTSFERLNVLRKVLSMTKRAALKTDTKQYHASVLPDTISTLLNSNKLDKLDTLCEDTRIDFGALIKLGLPAMETFCDDAITHHNVRVFFKRGTYISWCMQHSEQWYL